MADVTEHPSAIPVEFLNNGTVRIVLEGKVVRLRRPKIGEFRRMREALEDVNDEVRRLADELQDRKSEMDAQVQALFGEAEHVSDLELADRGKVRALRAEADQMARRLRDFQEDLRLRWFQGMVDQLAQDAHLSVTDEDGAGSDAEPWMADASFIADLVKHWQTVPLARGKQ